VQVTQIVGSLQHWLALSKCAGNTKNRQDSKEEEYRLPAFQFKFEVGHGMVLGLQFKGNQFKILSIMNQ
jgi:hypothetical protein